MKCSKKLICIVSIILCLMFTACENYKENPSSSAESADNLGEVIYPYDYIGLFDEYNNHKIMLGESQEKLTEIYKDDMDYQHNVFEKQHLTAGALLSFWAYYDKNHNVTEILCDSGAIFRFPDGVPLFLSTSDFIHCFKRVYKLDYMCDDTYEYLGFYVVYDTEYKIVDVAALKALKEEKSSADVYRISIECTNEIDGNGAIENYEFKKIDIQTENLDITEI